jgi:hypothetical protein
VVEELTWTVTVVPLRPFTVKVLVPTDATVPTAAGGVRLLFRWPEFGLDQALGPDVPVAAELPEFDVALAIPTPPAANPARSADAPTMRNHHLE